MCVIEKFQVYMGNKVLFIGTGMFFILLGLLPIYMVCTHDVYLKQGFISGGAVGVAVGVYSLLKGLKRQRIKLCKDSFYPPWKPGSILLRGYKNSVEKIAYVIVICRIEKQMDRESLKPEYGGFLSPRENKGLTYTSNSCMSRILYVVRNCGRQI